MASPPATTAAAAAAAAKAATLLTTTTAAFHPRQTFGVSPNIQRSFFLGHHHAGLARMRQALANIGLIIECRDFRVPLSSWNPLLERSLAPSSSSSFHTGERARIIVYTHRDLAPQTPAAGRAAAQLRDFHLAQKHAHAVLFTGAGATHSAATRDLLAAVKAVARERDALTGLRALVVGMPNAGKSTLLNALRRRGLAMIQQQQQQQQQNGEDGKPDKTKKKPAKVARTGANPGVTRKLSSPVRIVGAEGTEPGDAGVGEGVFVVDTPGVFVPYVSDPERMLKLALVGCVKDGVVPRETLADYLLFQLNLQSAPSSSSQADGGYEYVSRLGLPGPTNDVSEFLEAVGRRVGKLARGGGANYEAAAEWAVQEWRGGGLGRLLLDEVTPAALASEVEAAKEDALSMNQARKREKEARKARNEAKRAGVLGGGGGDGDA